METKLYTTLWFKYNWKDTKIQYDKIGNYYTGCPIEVVPNGNVLGRKCLAAASVQKFRAGIGLCPEESSSYAISIP